MGRFSILRRISVLACLAAAVAMLAAAGTRAESNVLFIFDASGSMKEKLETGESRIAVGRRDMKEALGTMPADVRLGLLMYGHRKAKDCSDIELVSPIGADDAGTIASHIEGAPAKGETPIADALKQAVRSFAALKGQSNRIVLVNPKVRLRPNFDGISADGADDAIAGRLRGKEE